MTLELAALLTIIFATGVQTEGPISLKTVVCSIAIVVIAAIAIFGLR